MTDEKKTQETILKWEASESLSMDLKALETIINEEIVILVNRLKDHSFENKLLILRNMAINFLLNEYAAVSLENRPLFKNAYREMVDLFDQKLEEALTKTKQRDDGEVNEK